VEKKKEQEGIWFTHVQRRHGGRGEKIDITGNGRGQKVFFDDPSCQSVVKG